MLVAKKPLAWEYRKWPCYTPDKPQWNRPVLHSHLQPVKTYGRLKPKHFFGGLGFFSVLFDNVFGDYVCFDVPWEKDSVGCFSDNAPSDHANGYARINDLWCRIRFKLHTKHLLSNSIKLNLEIKTFPFWKSEEQKCKTHKSNMP